MDKSPLALRACSLLHTPVSFNKAFPLVCNHPKSIIRYVIQSAPHSQETRVSSIWLRLI